MAFRYDKQKRQAVDDEKKVTIRIPFAFHDALPPFECATSERSFSICYEITDTQHLSPPKNDDIHGGPAVTVLLLYAWTVKCAFVNQMRKHIHTEWPDQIMVRDLKAFYQNKFAELERIGLGRDYEEWKAYIREGVHAYWTEGDTSMVLRVEFKEAAPHF